MRDLINSIRLSRMKDYEIWLYSYISRLKIVEQTIYVNSTFYVDDKDIIFEYDKQNKHLICDHDIVYHVLNNTYKLRYKNIYSLLKRVDLFKDAETINSISGYRTFSKWSNIRVIIS